MFIIELCIRKIDIIIVIDFKDEDDRDNNNKDG